MNPPGTSLPSDAENRFAFGRNWDSFANQVDTDRLEGARRGIETLLKRSDLRGMTFLDIGSGSGLMALAAHHMGATVTAFDYDDNSVATSIRIRDAMADSEAYTVSQGSVLDAAFMDSLGTFDIVYSWGVLHHTGDLWSACELAGRAVAPGGQLAIAIYNDQGAASRVWKRIKKRYVDSGALGRKTMVLGAGAYFSLGARLSRAASFGARTLMPTSFNRVKPAPAPVAKRERGMDRKHDLVDWVGGYPFEVAKPEEVFDFYSRNGFDLRGLRTCAGGLGCNEFLFEKSITA